MSNRTLFFLTSLIVLAISLLLLLNLSFFLSGKEENQPYLKYNFIRGMAIQYNEKLYTLNFKQQNQVIEWINRSIKINETDFDKQSKPEIQKIIVYLFDKPDLIINPVAIIDQNLVFFSLELSPHGYLQDISEGNLLKLVSEAHDPATDAN